MDKITKLSQAIRIGSTLRQQGFNEFFSMDGSQSCALGAAYEACTGEMGGADRFGTTIYSYLSKRFRVTPRMLRDVAGMNNEGKTREECADWLEGQNL